MRKVQMLRVATTQLSVKVVMKTLKNSQVKMTTKNKSIVRKHANFTRIGWAAGVNSRTISATGPSLFSCLTICVAASTNACLSVDPKAVGRETCTCSEGFNRLGLLCAMRPILSQSLQRESFQN